MSLEELRLWSNNLTTEPSTPEQSFLYSLTNCKYLKYLELSWNPLNCSLSFLTSIANFSASLQYLRLYDCKIKGNIPTEIGSLSNILVLDLSPNELSGFIPASIGRLKTLQDLELGDNKLQGPLPAAEFCDLKELYQLVLIYNELEGPMPRCLVLGDGLKDILSVDLSSNYLSGSLPFDIGNLKVLTRLNLSRNLLSSEIPFTITWSYSYIIRLEGEIPSRGPFLNFTAESFTENYALCGSSRLRVPPCQNNIRKKSKNSLLHALRYVLPTFASIIIAVAFIIVYKKRQRGNINLAIEEDTPLKKWSRISYYQLLQGTDGFNENNLLGSGSFGTVYKGILPNGATVAIKVFNLQIEGAFRSFDVDCEVMRNILHRNLVKVITSCSNIDFKALVLEFMPNGSLEKWLYSSNYFLDILQRINILIDVALALEYLHLGHPMPIIHCDLKPSNVLLDEDMVAHVGDFGIAKLLGEEDSMKQTMTLATIGYMAPEYGAAGIISVKSDVYSYGVLLMEIFTRKRPTDEIFAGKMNMRDWVKMSLSNGIIGVADSTLVHKEDEYFVVKANCISSIMKLALDCSSELPEDRMDMKDVASLLKNIKRKFLNSIDD
ncbi:hypothetical protein PTKIN_Ptkin16aG0091200 [Pterospermum kingtungense]